MFWAFGTTCCETNPLGKRQVRSVQLPLLHSNPNKPAGRRVLAKNKMRLREFLARNVWNVQGETIALEALAIMVLAGAHECSQRGSGKTQFRRLRSLAARRADLNRIGVD